MAQRGLSQHGLAKTKPLDTTQSTVRAWLEGTVPRKRMLELVAQALKVSPEWLETGEGKADAFEAHLDKLREASALAQTVSSDPNIQQAAFDSLWKLRALSAEAKLAELSKYIDALSASLKEHAQVDHISPLSQKPVRYDETRGEDL